MEKEDRLARIESKLDKLSDAVVAIARTEEQIATIFTMQRLVETKLETHTNEIAKLRERSHDISNQVIALSSVVSKVDSQEELLQDLRLDTHDNTKMSQKIEKLTWISIASVLSLLTFVITN